MKNILTIKSTNNVLEFWFDENSSYTLLYTALREKLNANLSFYSGAAFDVMIFGKHFTDIQKRELKRILLTEYGMKNVNFSDEETPLQKEAPSSPTKEGSQKAPDSIIPFSFTADEHAFVTHTLRSGQTINCKGDVVIIGDVNAGATIIAGGNIAVFGKLRGVVHAGAYGKTNAIIVATNFLASQIRICGTVALLPKRKQTNSCEIAKLVDGKIVITSTN